MTIIKEGMIIKVSLSILLSAAGGLIVITSWLIALSMNVSAQGKAMEAAQVDTKEYTKTLNSIDRRLSVIESEVKRTNE